MRDDRDRDHRPDGPGASDQGGEDRERLMKRATRLEWATIALFIVTVPLVALVAGQSQAMKASWMEDTLSFLPPIAFLVAARRSRRRADLEHPYGHHRSVGVGHLVSAVALLAMGVYLVVDSTMGLLTGERAPIGLTVIAGHAIWAGWLMIAVLVATNVPPMLLGFVKMKLAEPLHDKVLYADADMNKANWTTALATVAGVLGIGIGWWWADAVAALFVSVSVLHDGIGNLRTAIGGLTDVRAKTYDDSAPHPVIAAAERTALERPWIRQVQARVRDLGHVLHAEVFVVPEGGEEPTLARIAELDAALLDLDPQLADVVIAPVADLPGWAPGGHERGADPDGSEPED